MRATGLHRGMRGQWSFFQHPVEQWGALPTFVIFEVMVYVLTIFTWKHAMAKQRTMVWALGISIGIFNDLFWMGLPNANNFWHAQALFMLTDRLPLYIPCVYVVVFYVGASVAAALKLPALAEAASAGLVSHLVYAPYDIAGPRFLWWTWHTGDTSVSMRQANAPFASSMFVMFYFMMCTAMLHGFFLPTKESNAFTSVSRVVPQFWAKAVVSAFATVLLMATFIGLMTALSGEAVGIPGPRSYYLTVLLLLALVCRGWSERGAFAPNPEDRQLAMLLVLYFVGTLGIFCVGDATSHISLGQHQQFGPCSGRDTDVMGQSRPSNVCKATAEYSLCGKQSPPDGTTWYEVCGKMRNVSQEEAIWMGTYTALGIATIYAVMCVKRGATKALKKAEGPPPSPSTVAKSPKKVAATPRSPSTRGRSPAVAKTPASARTKSPATAKRAKSPATRAKSPATRAKSPATGRRSSIATAATPNWLASASRRKSM